MSISSKLEKLETDITSAYSAIDNKGGTIPQNKNTENLANAIGSISTGIDTSDATAIASDILSTKTAYVDGVKLTGSMTNNGALNYTPTTSSQSIPAGYTSGGTIGAVTSSIDNNIVAGNIKSGTTILGVTGNVVELNGETKTITPTTSQQTINPSTGKNAMTQVTVNAVTSSIDNNITAENIKKDVSILGVTGTYEGAGSINILNGILEQYKANTSTISANTFVETTYLKTQLATQFSSAGSTSEYCYLSVVQLDTNKVFVIYKKSDYYIYGLVCNISGTTITIGTETKLSSVYDARGCTATLIDTDKVFVCICQKTQIHGAVCTINGTTITPAASEQLLTVSNLANYTPVEKIDTNKVFIAHRNGNYLYGVVCSIEGTTITVGTDTQLSTDTSSYLALSLKQLDIDKIFLTHKKGGGLNASICTINELTITKGADLPATFTNSYGVTMASSVLLDTNKVLVSAGIYAGGTDRVRFYLCTINGTTITNSRSDSISGQNIYQRIYSTKVATNKSVTIHRKEDYLYGIASVDNGTSIVNGNDTKLSDVTGSYNDTGITQIDNDKIFVVFAASGTLYGIACLINGTAIHLDKNIIPSTSKIEGLLVTEATTSTAGDVWVLNS